MFKIFLQYFPRILFLIVSVVISYKGVNMAAFSEISEFIVFVIILCLQTTINLLVIAESIFVPRAFNKLKSQFEYTTAYLETRLNVRIPMKEFKRNFMFKVILNIAMFLTTIAAARTKRAFQPVDVLIFLSMNYKHFTTAHILLNVEYLKHILATLNRQFDGVQCEHALKVFNSNISEICFCFKLHKFVHFKLWKISQLINKRFGLILIALVMAYILEVSYSAYWIIVYWISNNTDITIFRKYHRPIELFLLAFPLNQLLKQLSRPSRTTQMERMKLRSESAAGQLVPQWISRRRHSRICSYSISRA